MLKKFTFGLLMAIFLSASFVVPQVGAENTSVCGMDGVTYDSSDAAETAGVDVSYEFACTVIKSEAGLYEAKSDTHFVGVLIEIGSTDVPTTIIVRPNKGGIDRTVEVSADTVLGRSNDGYTNLHDWIPGDQIRVIGKNNENTDVVEATILVNHSIKFKHNRGINGWITTIDKDATTITYQWANIEHTFKYDDNTRFVAAGKNPASVDDLVVNDRIRGRLNKVRTDNDSAEDTAKIVVVLRRGSDLFMKIRTFKPHVTLVRLDSTMIPTTIQVRMDKTPGIRANDVNNLIGTEGRLITVNVLEHTKIVRKYFGETNLDEFSVGDKLRIVGRVNDDGTVDAKMIKNNSTWKTNTRGHAGVVNEINVDESYLIVNWKPYRHITKKRLRARLKDAKNTVNAQIIGDSGSVTGSIAPIAITAKQRLRNLIKIAAPQKIGAFLRTIKHKKVKIDRIKHKNIKVGQLIKRLPHKKIKVIITDDTKIIIGTNDNGTIADINNGDKVRMRGVWSKTDQEFTAETIVVVNSLPEVEGSEDMPLDDVNEIVDEVVTDDGENAIVGDTSSDTEEEVDEDGNVVEEETVVCVLDAKVCEDGSSVGRVAPDCEFSQCPEDGTDS